MKNSKEKLLVDLTEKSNKIFRKLCNKKIITQKELKYFTYSFKNASGLGICTSFLRFTKDSTTFQDAQ